ncbi:unnamed protein product [Closterium sp. Naga37s-1]|nr:unnamed protein product [Closterium sp. Naga37s-1]
MLEFAVVELEIEGFYETSSYSTYLRPPDGVRKVWAGHNISRFDNARIREAFSALARAPPVPAGVVDTYDLLRREFGTRAGNMKMASLGAYCGLGMQVHRWVLALLSQALESLKIDSAATCQNLAAGASHANSKAGDAEGELEDGEVVGEEEEEEEGEEEWEDCDNEQARSYGKEKHSESIPLGTGESREGGEAQGEAGRKEQVGESQACEGECMVCPGWWQQRHEQHVKDGASWPIACAHFDPFWLQAVVAPPAAGAGNGGNDSSRGSGWGGGRRYSLRGGSARVYPNGFTPQAPSGAADIAPAGGGFAVESAPARVLLLYNGRSLHVRECGARIKMSVSDRFAFDESTGRPSFSLLLAISPASAAAIAACFDALLACVGSGEGAAARGEEGRVEGAGEEERDGGCREEVRSPFVASWEEDGMRVIRVK